MLVIFEGVDGSGKTFLARAFCEKTGALYAHKGPPVENAYIEYVAPLAWYEPGAGYSVACDRWHVGEAVYGPRYRGGSILDELGKDGRTVGADVTAFLSRRGAVIIYCHGSAVTCARRVALRDGEQLDPLTLARDMSDYERVLRGNGLHTLHSGTAAPLHVDRIILAAEAAEERACQNW